MEWWLQKVWKQGNDFFHGWKNQCWRGIRSSLVIAKESSPQHEVIVTTEAWHVIGMACCILKLTGKTWQVPARSNDQIIAFDPDLMAKTAKWLGKQFVASVAKRGCRKVYDLLSTFHEDWTDGTENSPVFEAPYTAVGPAGTKLKKFGAQALGFLCDGFWVCPKVGVPTSHWFVGRASWWPVNFRRTHARWMGDIPNKDGIVWHDWKTPPLKDRCTSTFCWKNQDFQPSRPSNVTNFKLIQPEYQVILTVILDIRRSWQTDLLNQTNKNHSFLFF